MLEILIKIFIAALFINLLYELAHSILYKTCLDASLKRYVFLILKAAVFDGAVILVAYLSVSFIFQSRNVFSSFYQFSVFALIILVFAYIWEIYSLKKEKWEYSPQMPIVFGAGITPLAQLPLTGLVSVYLAAYF